MSPTATRIASLLLNLLLAVALGMAGANKLTPAIDAGMHAQLVGKAPTLHGVWAWALTPLAIDASRFLALIGALEVAGAVLRVAGLVLRGLGLSRLGGLLHTAVMGCALYTHFVLNDVATGGVPSAVLFALCIVQLLLAASAASHARQKAEKAAAAAGKAN